MHSYIEADVCGECRSFDDREAAGETQGTYENDSDFSVCIFRMHVRTCHRHNAVQAPAMHLTKCIVYYEGGYHANSLRFYITERIH